MSKYIAGIAIISIVAAFIACGCGAPIPTDPVEKAKIEEDIYETILLERFNPGSTGDYAYISIKNADPGEEFLTRLRSKGLKARKGSEFDDFQFLIGHNGPWNFEEVQWLSGKKVHVKVSIKMSDSFTPNRYWLEKKCGKWVIVKKGFKDFEITWGRGGSAEKVGSRE